MRMLNAIHYLQFVCCTQFCRGALPVFEKDNAQAKKLNHMVTDLEQLLMPSPATPFELTVIDGTPYTVHLGQILV